MQNEVFVPMARIETIKLVIITIIFRGWSLHQLDVKVFINRPLKEDVYDIKIGNPPWTLNRRIYCFLLQLVFNKCTTKYGVYVTTTLDDLILYMTY
ncbi:hypothetical protein CR513_53718, partial [Mucuna pruriens]